jgi:hypothetical protein
MIHGFFHGVKILKTGIQKTQITKEKVDWPEKCFPIKIGAVFQRIW